MKNDTRFFSPFSAHFYLFMLRLWLFYMSHCPTEQIIGYHYSLFRFDRTVRVSRYCRASFRVILENIRVYITPSTGSLLSVSISASVSTAPSWKCRIRKAIFILELPFPNSRRLAPLFAHPLVFQPLPQKWNQRFSQTIVENHNERESRENCSLNNRESS